MSQEQVYDVAATHYERLRLYLSAYLQSQRASGAQSNQRTSAREKLTRLTKQQFTELSTDVFDEMNRRQLDSKEVPFLPVRDDFHPKRNQARQKLATLPSSRFKDLASDVYYEIERRFPQVVEDYDAKYGSSSNSEPLAIASAPLEAVNGSLRSAPEPKVVQLTNTSQYPNAQVYETQYSQGYDNKPSSAPVNAPRTPELGTVNFASLDNLMADLGNMMSPGRGHYEASPVELEKIRGEYENRIKQLEQQLEESLRHKERLAELDRDLAEQEKINRERTAELQALEARYSKLKEEHESLQDDYNNQQQIANDIRLEATNLLDEIKSLSRKNEELHSERERDRTTIEQLKEELARYREDTSGGQSTRDRSMAQLETDDLDIADDGVIDRSRVTAYQTAVDDLLRAARSDTPTSVLVAMKSIVIACKNITEDTESFESSSTALKPEELDQLGETKNNLASALNNLMNAAKVHATSMGQSNVAVLDSAATQLTATIVELLKLLRLKQGRSYDTDSQIDGINQGRSDAYEIDELKIFLEKQTDQIVQAIQTLLYAMRQSTSFGQDFKDKVSGITSIVDNLVRVSRKTLAKPAATEFRTRGELILQDLSNANVKLEELGASMVDSPQSKTLKQRLASSSYEIAKYVKELISLIE